MPKAVLAIAAAIVLAAGIVLVFLLKGGSDEATPTVQKPADGPRPTPPPVSSHGSVTVTDTKPNLPVDTTKFREYAVGDVIVRDHRREGGSGDDELPPNPHPPDQKLIAATVTQDISRKIKALIPDCVAGIPAGAATASAGSGDGGDGSGQGSGSGARPRLEGVITVAIKNNTLTVTKSAMQLRNMSGPEVEAAKTCLETRSVGLATSAIDEPDVESYTIHISAAIMSMR